MCLLTTKVLFILLSMVHLHRTGLLGFAFLAMSLSACMSVDPEPSSPEKPPAPTRAAEPKSYTYLTWRKSDTAHTMTVNFNVPRTMVRAPIETFRVYFSRVARGGRLKEYERFAEGTLKSIAGIERDIHAIDLDGLAAARDYYFVVAQGENVMTPELKFRTLPDDDRTVRFVAGGDMNIDAETEELSRQAASFDPDVALVGGDIAYDDSKVENAARWETWLDIWNRAMVTPSGRMIPMLLAIGNHEVPGGFGAAIESSLFYPTYFAQEPGRSYFARPLNGDTVFFMLDSGHAAAHEGAQLAWMNTEFERHKPKRRKFAIYHVPLFPSFGPLDLPWTVAGQKHWVPVFDKYQLTAAFENHDHALKRTKPLKGGAITADGTGTIYLGDGCWGQKLRKPDLSRAYLAFADSVRHVWLVEVAREKIKMQAIDKAGVVHDSVELL